jgi:hypothetical protein
MNIYHGIETKNIYPKKTLFIKKKKKKKKKIKNNIDSKLRIFFKIIYQLNTL